MKIIKLNKKNFSSALKQATTALLQGKVVVPSISAAKKYVLWNLTAEKLAKKFLHGALSIALPLKSQNKILKKLSANSGYLGIRMADNKFALALVKNIGAITATSANPSKHLSRGFDAYSAKDVIKQFANKKYKPDLIIDAGNLPKRKPSTFVKITENEVQFLREGPITKAQILRVLKSK